MAKAFKIERKSAHRCGKFCPAGGFFSLLRFFSFPERKEMKALKSLCAEREKCAAPQAHSAKRNPCAPQARHPAQQDKLLEIKVFTWKTKKEENFMPYVNIKITKEGNVTPEQKKALIEGATNLLADVLHKNRATTVVVIDEVDTDNWGIGGIPVTEIRKNAKK
jgi:4-oxalocrotonate tautomerase